MANCKISGKECPDGCWLKQKDNIAKAKLLKKPKSSEAPQPENFGDQVTIARRGIHAFERYENAIEDNRKRARRECPSCLNLNQI